MFVYNLSFGKCSRTRVESVSELQTTEHTHYDILHHLFERDVCKTCQQKVGTYQELARTVLITLIREVVMKHWSIVN